MLMKDVNKPNTGQPTKSPTLNPLGSANKPTVHIVILMSNHGIFHTRHLLTTKPQMHKHSVSTHSFTRNGKLVITLMVKMKKPQNLVPIVWLLLGMCSVLTVIPNVSLSMEKLLIIKEFVSFSAKYSSRDVLKYFYD